MKLLFELLEKLLADLLERSPLLKEFVERVILIWALNVEKALVAEVIVAVALALLFTVPLICIMLAVQLALSSRRARVFISFQHDREAAADALVSTLVGSGIKPLKLPFLADPEHDALLDQVAQAIRDCDVFLCIPGIRPSFVESEVSMAFGLQRPLIFLLNEQDTPRLPNTAKKGYPIFALGRLRDEGFATLVKFCSYLAGDWRSTVRLYSAISFPWVALFIILVNILGFLVMRGTVHRRSLPRPSFTLLWIENVLRDPTTLCLAGGCLLFFFAFYTYFIANKFKVRARVRRAIATERFDEQHLPKILDSSLTGKEVLTVLYRGAVLAEHESKARDG